MILSDGEIKKRVQSGRLLEFHDTAKIKYCGCELTLGKAVAPKTGDVLSISAKPRHWWSNLLSTKKTFVIEPSETMILVTAEKLNMPNDLCATYGQLNRLANQGLMILNTSIVEPGYSGPLSCVLVNFSSQRHALAPGDSIAKLTFHQVQGTPESVFPQQFTHETYEPLASKNAINLPSSLLDISGVEERVSQKLATAVKRGIAWGGIAIAVLLFWSQMEGFLSDWIYKRTGFMDTKAQVEKHVDDALKQQQSEYQKQNEELQRRIEELQKQLAVPKTAKGTRGGAGNP